jgi:uncharacterized protein
MIEVSTILPTFRYHPDPIASGSIEKAEITCAACGELRAYVYVGSIYAEDNLERAICPWCISSGLAHDKFGAEFTDIDGVGDYEQSPTAPIEVREEIAFRTPGFNGWQQERWLIHCGDACAFISPAGKAEIKAFGNDDLIEVLRDQVGMNKVEFADYLNKLNKQEGPTAYIFRCLHCGQYQGYSDC